MQPRLRTTVLEGSLAPSLSLSLRLLCPEQAVGRQGQKEVLAKSLVRYEDDSDQVLEW